MKHAVQKVLDCNNDNVMVTDRGTMFYQDMIVDFRGIPTCSSMHGSGCNTFIATTEPNWYNRRKTDMIESPKQELQ
jgi:2-dehydro-3-deoxyphosphooctonate aldolase (KDO 8-P synthase)